MLKELIDSGKKINKQPQDKEIPQKFQLEKTTKLSLQKTARYEIYSFNIT